METGLGIATGDAIYAAIAALGLASVTRFMLAYDRPLHLIAGAFLLYLGARTLFARTATEAPQPEARLGTRLAASAYLSSLLLTLTNPPTIISFVAVSTVLAPPAGFDLRSAMVTVAGVLVGSTAWWLILTASVAAVRHAIGARARRWLDVASAAVLAFFGVKDIRQAVE
jgi:threonine/homoserine/homoserine lactone efflux protein